MLRTVRLFILLLTLGITYFTPGLTASCDVQAYFVSPVIDYAIEPVIIHALTNAQSEVLIAMYSFTDDQLGAAVVAAFKRGVNVRVLLDDGQDSTAQGREWPKLVDAGIPVGVEHENGLLHDKFAVIDSVIVITGSYNWTDNADTNNFENIVFITCPEIAQAYRHEFFRMANEIGLGWLDSNTTLPSSSPCLDKLNNASYSDFKAVYGIGDVLAQRLVAAQPFRSIYGLDDVPGIGPVRMKAILDYFCPDR